METNLPIYFSRLQPTTTNRRRHISSKWSNLHQLTSAFTADFTHTQKTITTSKLQPYGGIEMCIIIIIITHSPHHQNDGEYHAAVQASCSSCGNKTHPVDNLTTTV